LRNRKPVSGDDKSIEEVLGEDVKAVGDEGVEFGVMVMGGASVRESAVTSGPAETAKQTKEEGEDKMEGVEKTQVNEEEKTTRAAQGPAGEEVLGTEEFWMDLKAFLGQRLKVDEGGAGKVVEMFKGAWEGGGKKI
jgi:hypothetical protein